MSDLSVRDVAERARTSDRTVRRWIAENKLPATRTADGWTVAEADLAALLDGRPSPINGHSESVRPPNGHVDGRPAGRPSEASYLADLVRQLAERAEANAAAAAMWQARAEYLAGQLEQAQHALAAPAGPASQERPQIGPSATVTVEPSQQSPENTRRAPWWRRWLSA